MYNNNSDIKEQYKCSTCLSFLTVMFLVFSAGGVFLVSVVF